MVIMRALILCALMCLVGCGCTSGGGGVNPKATPVTVSAAQPANGMIIDAASGRAVAAVNANGPITGAVADGSGGWFVAGAFTTIDGHARANLAHVHSDGTLDPRWHGPALSPPGALSFLSLARSGPRLFVAGGFNTPGHLRPGVLALHAADGSRDPAWTMPRACFDGAWEARVSAGRVWVATACAARPCLVAVSVSTGHPIAWSPVIDAIGETGCVNDFAIQGTTVFFTGGFTAVGGQPRNGIAAASTTTGHVIRPFAPMGSCAVDGHAIATVGGRVFVGGDGCPIAAFAAATGHRLWAWSRDGNASTYALLTTSGRVYVGGAFSQLAGVAAHGFIALDPRTGHPTSSWHPTKPSQVYALAASGERILVGGR